MALGIVYLNAWSPAGGAALGNWGPLIEEEGYQEASLEHKSSPFLPFQQRSPCFLFCRDVSKLNHSSYEHSFQSLHCRAFLPWWTAAQNVPRYFCINTVLNSLTNQDKTCASYMIRSHFFWKVVKIFLNCNLKDSHSHYGNQCGGSSRS